MKKKQPAAAARRLARSVSMSLEPLEQRRLMAAPHLLDPRPRTAEGRPESFANTVYSEQDLNDAFGPPSLYEWEFKRQQVVLGLDQAVVGLQQNLQLMNLFGVPNSWVGTPLEPGEAVPSDWIHFSVPSGATSSETVTFNTFDDPSAPILPDGNYELTLPSEGIASADTGEHFDADPNTPGNQDLSLPFFVLTGDIDHNRIVDWGDYAMVLPPNSGYDGYLSGDVDYSGSYDGTDADLMDEAFLAHLSPPISPNQVNYLTSSMTGTSVTLNWRPPEGTFDGFYISRSSDGITFNQLPGLVNPTPNADGSLSWTDTGLLEGHKYWYRVRAYSQDTGESPSTNKVWAVTNLPGPITLGTSDLTSSSVTLNWTDNAQNEDGYKISIVDEEGNIVEDVADLPTQSGTGTAMSYTVTDLDPNTSYIFQVIAYTAAATSMPAQATITTKPSVSVQVTQDTALETGEAPGTFLLTRSGDTSSALDVYYAMGGTAHNDTDYNLLDGTAHFDAGQSSITLDVTPFNDTLIEDADTATLTIQPDSAYSIENASGTVTILDNDAGGIDEELFIPSNLAAQAVQGEEDLSIQLSWDAVDGATSYFLERATDSAFSHDVQQSMIGADSSTYYDSNVSDLAPGSTLYYRLLTVSGGLTATGWSAYASVTIPDPLPASPDNLYAVPVSDSDVRLTWHDRSGSETGYRIERATDEDFTENLTTIQTDNAPTDVSLSAGYQQADLSSVLHTSGDVILSDWQSEGLAAVVGESESISVTSSTSGGVTTYNIVLPDDAILINNTDGSWGVSGSDVVHIAQGSHTFTISGSTSIQAADLQAAGFATRDASDDVKMAEMSQRNWVAEDGTSAYRIAVVGDNPSVTALVYSPTASYTDTVQEDGTYYYRVFAESDAGDSFSPTNIAPVTTPPAPVQEQPDAIVSMPYDDQAADVPKPVVEWSDRSDNETAFEVTRATDEDFTENVVLLGRTPANVTEFTDTTAVDGTDYYYRVEAINGYQEMQAQTAQSASAPSVANAISISRPVTWLVGSDGVNVSAPAATASQQTFMLGNAVHAFFTPSAFRQFFNPLTSRITWHFGESGSLYNDELHGFNAAHVYNSPGTYTIYARFEDPATGRFKDSVPLSITITAAPTGSQVVQVPNQAALSQSLTTLHNMANKSNVKLLFAEGQTFNITQQIDLRGFNNVYVGSYQPAGAPDTKPVLVWQGNTDGVKYFFVLARNRNITVADLSFDSSNAAHFQTPRLFTLNGTNLTLLRCDIGNVDGLEDTATADGILLQQNSVPSKLVDGYLLYAKDAFDTVVLDNFCAGSNGQSDVRIAFDSIRASVYKNTLLTPVNDPNNPSILNTNPKSALRLFGGGYFYAEKNTLAGSANMVGPLGGADADPSQDETDFVVFDSNISQPFTEIHSKVGSADGNALRLTRGLKHAVIRNNVFFGSSRIYLTGDDNPKAGDKTAEDVWIVNNTRVNATDPDHNGQKFLVYNFPGSAPQKMQFKFIHFANNMTARTLTGGPTLLSDGDGVSLAPVGITNAWHQELTGTLPDAIDPPLLGVGKSRWWVADNVWTPGANFKVDNETFATAQDWNLFNLGNSNDSAVTHGGVKIVSSTDFAPISQTKARDVNVGLRTIYGTDLLGHELQVAAWDYLGNLRPATGVTAGAVQATLP